MDRIDSLILEQLQRDGALSQRELAERVGLSQNACWRRMQRLTQAGVLRGTRAIVDPAALGLRLTVFIMIRTRHHDDAWSARFRARIAAIPDIVEFHRIGGEWDYMAKAITTSMAGYDACYKALIADMDLERVTGVFSMESIFEGRPLNLSQQGTSEPVSQKGAGRPDDWDRRLVVEEERFAPVLDSAPSCPRPAPHAWLPCVAVD